MNDKIRDIHEKVKSYYSELTNEKGGELASGACCCTASGVPEQIKGIISELPDEILTKYYGCGSPIPDRIEGCTVLDLGCGTGRDVYAASKLVGKNGKVIGIDMNDDQLAVAEKYQAEMAQKWGFANVEFKKGYIEDLAAAGIADASVDVVISNCVINLAPDKSRVFAEIWRVLKDGGVLFFSDMFADKKVPDEIKTNRLLLGECLGGALSNAEFREIMKQQKWRELKVVNSLETPVTNAEIKSLIGDIRYVSATIRAVKTVSDSCCCESSEAEGKAPFAVPYAAGKEAPCCCANDHDCCC